MPLTRTCPRGHEWDGDPSECPGCDDDSWNRSAGSTFDSKIADELPPPPRSIRLTPRSNQPTIPPSSSLPVIPGYEVLDELGRGGMGTVYRARQLSLNRLVALKLISAGGAADPGELARFRAEAEAVAQLQHPNIVQVHEVGEADGRPYLALELVAGGTLADALDRAPVSAGPAAELVETLSRAVQYAHTKGVIHRDLKPGNILLSQVTSQDSLASVLSPKVADFGLAKRIGNDSSQTTTGVVVGTPSYMAPEQAAGLGKLIGPACDIYALGAILYETLTGRPPFHAASPVETLQQVISSDPVPPGKLQPKLPRDLETICLKCLQKESRKRYASAGDLADDLRRFLDGKPILARRTGVGERAMKWARRRPTAAALVAVSICAAIALATLGVRYYRTLERHNLELAKSAQDLAHERDEARKQSERAESNLGSANDAIVQMLRRVGIERLVNTPFMDRTRADLLEDALRFFDRLLVTQAGDRRLLLQRAHTLELAGRVQFVLGRFARAQERYDEALVLTDELAAEPDSLLTRPKYQWLRALILNNRSQVLMRLGEAAKGRADQEAALALREELLAAEPSNPENEYDVAVSNLNLALICYAEQKPKDMELYLGRARPRAQSLTREHPEEDRYWYLLGLILNDSAAHGIENDDLERAGEFLHRSVEIWRKLRAQEPGSVEYLSELARSLSNQGTALRMQGYYRRALTPLLEAQLIRERVAREHPDIWQAVVGLASTEYEMAEVQREQGDHAPALAGYLQAIKRLEGEGNKRKDDANARRILTDAHIGLANLLGAEEKYVEMADLLKRAIDLAGPSRRAELRMTRALALSHAGRSAEARKEADDVLTDAELDATVLFDAGRLFARTATEEKDADQKEEFAAKAVALLKRAERGGYFHLATRRRHLELHEDFKPLRGRKDFRALRAKVEDR
jgi:hypothetical protein